jgi:hypothetical protein
MIGSGEKTTGDAFQLGITAEKVIRKANKPVWVVFRKTVLSQWQEYSVRMISQSLPVAR